MHFTFILRPFCNGKSQKRVTFRFRFRTDLGSIVHHVLKKGSRDPFPVQIRKSFLLVPEVELLQQATHPPGLEGNQFPTAFFQSLLFIFTGQRVQFQVHFLFLQLEATQVDVVE